MKQFSIRITFSILLSVLIFRQKIIFGTSSQILKQDNISWSELIIREVARNLRIKTSIDFWQQEIILLGKVHLNEDSTNYFLSIFILLKSWLRTPGRKAGKENYFQQFQNWRPRRIQIVIRERMSLWRLRNYI